MPFFRQFELSEKIDTERSRQRSNMGCCSSIFRKLPRPNPGRSRSPWRHKERGPVAIRHERAISM